MKLQFLTTDEMVQLENHAVDSHGIAVDEMMQHAGKALYDLIKKEILPGQKAPHVLIVVGKGNNGGDALVAARLLHQDLIYTEVLLAYNPDEMSPAARRELDKCENTGLHINHSVQSPHWEHFHLIVDGLFGFSLRGDPRPPADQIIEQILCSKVPVLAVDVPSGLDVRSGNPGRPTIKADWTLTYGMPKAGLNPQIAGKVFIGDLGIPKIAYKEKGYSYPNFAGKTYIPLV